MLETIQRWVNLDFFDPGRAAETVAEAVKEGQKVHSTDAVPVEVCDCKSFAFWNLSSLLGIFCAWLLI